MTTNDAIGEIRDTANKGIFLHNIKRHGFIWDMVCAAIDMIEDTQLAIKAYSQIKGADTGTQYLKVYGLFQTLFLQQDSVVNLAEGLKVTPVKIFADDDSKYVREIRTKYFGHPTKNSSDGKVTYHGITRMSVGNGLLQGWTYPKFSTEDINISQALKKHQGAVEKSLEKILNELRIKEKDYMDKFTEDLPVADHEYEFQKLYGWALGSKNDGVMAKSSANILDEELDKIKQGLQERYEDAGQVGYIIREITKAKYCLKVIKKGLDETKTDTKSSYYFEAHIDSLEQTFEEIIKTCNDINASFSTER